MPKKYPDEYKKMILEEVIKLGSISKVAKKYKLNFSLVYRWKRIYEEKKENINVEEINLDEIKKKKL